MSDERLRRWRLVLGEEGGTGVGLEGDDRGRDLVLEALYGRSGPGPGSPVGGRSGGAGNARGADSRTGGLGASAPSVARWLGDIRTYFPSSVVRVMQHDAMDRLGLRQLLLEPEMLGSVQPDVSLVATLLSLGRVIPEHSRETARQVVRVVTDELERRLAQKVRSAVNGALNRSARTRRPRHGDIDWHRTIQANMRHYQPEYKTVIPERLVGYGRKHPSFQRQVVLCIDQSGSMASSVVYASVFGAVLASMRSLRTKLVVFDTAVVDLTDQLGDPVDILFGVQLGGGTNINQAVAYCQSLINTPSQTVFILLSDLIEGGLREELLRRMGGLVRSGVTVVCLLALSDQGSPIFDHAIAGALTGMGIAAFACTPDLFPDLMAAAIEGRDLSRWASDQGIVVPAAVENAEAGAPGH